MTEKRAKRTNLLGQKIKDAALRAGIKAKDGRTNAKGWGSIRALAVKAGIPWQLVHDVCRDGKRIAFHHLAPLAKALAPHETEASLAAAWVVDRGAVTLDLPDVVNGQAALAALVVAWPSITPAKLARIIEACDG